MAARKTAVLRRPSETDDYLYEPVDRRIRGEWFGRTVVDSTRAVLVWAPGKPVPFYAFPREDVRLDLIAASLSPSRSRQDVWQWYDIVVRDHRAYSPVCQLDVDGLDDRLVFQWFRWGETGPGDDVDEGERWFEEETEVFTHPRDPYHRVDALRSSRRVRVTIGDVVVAETRNPVLVFETGLPTRYYLPPEDVDFSVLEESEWRTSCPYKGAARYWSFSGTPPAENVAWSYPEPFPGMEPIEGYVCFYDDAAEITVEE
ncbi:DUF427 domain-containing protein [Rhodococcus pyridinivorans]|uniref:DUF427 domain-containing protein n=1 Tax=Rhodococcus pyridinivorans TaxID=103816 RepID=UPI001E2FB4F6|nr:DUF427 domain-containing protein [Rhodococcus pyridinivorans]UGQ58237.1 DUF427 domain-containing protein [Rhodococcus pyridinivorans]